MFNILPGSGLGFSGSKEIAFGLGGYIWWSLEPPGPMPSYGGYEWTILDNMYSIGRDDDEILEILMILFNLIE